MVRMNPQTKIIVATAAVLVAIDIAVRLLIPARMVVVQQASPVISDVVTARQLRIVDDSGNAKVVIKLDSNNEPGMQMFDHDGNERLQLDTWRETPSLILMDRNEQQRVYFGMDTESCDGEYINLSDEDSHPIYQGDE